MNTQLTKDDFETVSANGIMTSSQRRAAKAEKPNGEVYIVLQNFDTDEIDAAKKMPENFDNANLCDFGQEMESEL